MHTDDKIKVFISSKCGGEHINFNQFVNNESINKEQLVKSAIRTDYDLVRRALKIALQETGIIDVYTFEDDLASTETAEDDFLEKLDRCDVVLFLIDNFNPEISEGLLKEIERAEQTNKRSIYLFFNDPSLEPTQIQKKLTSPYELHYDQIHDVRELIDKGYQSIIDDIIRIYHKYCHPRRIFEEIGDQSEELVKATLEETSVFKMNSSIEIGVPEKSVYKKLALTIKKIEDIANDFPLYKGETSVLDELTLSILNLLLGELKADEVDFDTLICELGKIQNSELHQFVKRRWKAISLFYTGEIDAAIVELKNIFKEYKSKKEFSEWLITDLLIDIRNFYFHREYSITTENFYSAQKKIDDQKSLYYFPIIDKLGKDIHDDIWDKNFNINTSSPSSVHFINYQMLYKNIANYLFTAIYYGSYSKIKSTLQQIQTILLDIVEKENNLINKKQLIKISILADDISKFKKIMRLYKSSLSHYTADELISIYALADSKITLEEKRYWKVILLQEIGYYFSDDHFNQIVDEIKEISTEWIKKDSQNVQLESAIIESIKQNIKRLPQVFIIDFVDNLFDKNLVRFYRDIFEILDLLIEVSSLDDELLNKLILRIENVLINKQINNENLGIERFLLKIRKKGLGNNEKIDGLVKKYYLQFYNGTYSLEIFSENRARFIEKYIDTILHRNEIQGVNKQYKFYADDPFKTIENIIKIDQIKLDEKGLLELIQVIKGTLLKNTQTYSTKISAMGLLIFLRSCPISFEYDWIETLTELEENYKEIAQSQDDYLRNITIQTFNIFWIVMKISFGRECSNELLENLAIINNQNDADKINALIALITLFKTPNIKIDELKELPIFVQFVSSFCFSGSSEIRRLTVIALYHLIDTQYGLFAIDQLSKMMSDDNYDIKLEITKQLSKIRSQNEIAFNYILGKARIDNHFLVRRSVANFG